MSPTSRRGRWLVASIVAGVGAAYFRDPELGRGRRARLVSRSRHVIRRGTSVLGRELRYLVDMAYQRALHRLRQVPPRPAEGRTLLDRVESELFADPTIPHGRLSLEVENATVVLRGQLDSQASIAKVEKAVHKISGVSAVKNLLHLAGTPAPNKAAALRASARVLEYGGWPEEPPPDVDSEK